MADLRVDLAAAGAAVAGLRAVAARAAVLAVDRALGEAAAAVGGGALAASARDEAAAWAARTAQLARDLAQHASQVAAALEGLAAVDADLADEVPSR